MSRIGNAPIEIQKDVTVTITGDVVQVKGAKGELTVGIPSRIGVSLDGAVLTVARKGEDKPTRALHGFVRSEIANAVTGVSKGWTKVLELSGVGYRANMSGNNLAISVGFSHPVTVTPPAGISFSVAESKITVAGINRQQVGQIAAIIRDIKKPEPYKGKGIKYENEHIRRKAGKAKAAGGAPGAK